MRLPPGRALVLALAALVVATTAAGATSLPGLTSVSTDPYTDSTGQHATEVEPDTYAYGSTLVAAFQVGRSNAGGSSNIGWAVLDGGSWSNGFLPSLTPSSTPAGSYDRVTDPSVAFDAAHGVWLINSLGLSGPKLRGVAVVVNRWDTKNSSPTWDAPVTVAAVSGKQDFDKNWIACDNWAGSPHYGRCYVEWDDFSTANKVHVAYSGDGGLSWTEGVLPNSGVIGGQPVAQPSGRVVMPIDSGNQSSVESFVSDDGGATWQGPFAVANIASHAEAGGMRSAPLPTAEVDAAGTVYVAWSDCRFIKHCTANDIVYATSADGQSWGSVKRIPIDPVASGVDHFLPGLGVDPSTSGGSAHLALAYYYYPVSKCGGKRGGPACELDVGYVSSTNGGSSWSPPSVLTQSSMALSWLPQTTEGRMVGDYLSTSFLGGSAYSVFAVANAPTGGSDCATATPHCDEEMYAPASALAAAGGAVSASEPVTNSSSDHTTGRDTIVR